MGFLGSRVTNAISNNPLGKTLFGGGNVISCEQHEPYRNFRFEVRVDGYISIGGFSKISGIKESSDEIQYREGNWQYGITVNKYPGLVKYEDVVLETGFSNDDTIIHWRAAVAGMGTLTTGVVADGTAEQTASFFGVPLPGIDVINYKKTVYIVMFNKGDPRVPGRTLVLYRAWPKALEISPLDAKGSEIVIESLTLAHSGLGWRSELEWKELAKQMGRGIAGQIAGAVF